MWRRRTYVKEVSEMAFDRVFHFGMVRCSDGTEYLEVTERCIPGSCESDEGITSIPDAMRFEYYVLDIINSLFVTRPR